MVASQGQLAVTNHGVVNNNKDMVVGTEITATVANSRNRTASSSRTAHNKIVTRHGRKALPDMANSRTSLSPHVAAPTSPVRCLLEILVSLTVEVHKNCSAPWV